MLFSLFVAVVSILLGRGDNIVYIKLEDAYNKICSVCYLQGHCMECYFNDDNGGCELKDIITDIPSADVVEVVRGEWVKINASLYYCSICKCVEGVSHYNFCRDCGADMRGLE